MTTSDKIDGIVTNRFLGLPIFFAVMALVYYVSVSTVGGWATDWVNDGVFADGWNFLGISSLHVPAIPELLNNGLEAVNCAAWLQSLIVDGIVAGRDADTWPVLPLLWTVSSVNSAFRENPSYRC